MTPCFSIDKTFAAAGDISFPLEKRSRVTWRSCDQNSAIFRSRKQHEQLTSGPQRGPRVARQISSRHKVHLTQSQPDCTMMPVPQVMHRKPSLFFWKCKETCQNVNNLFVLPQINYKARTILDLKGLYSLWLYSGISNFKFLGQGYKPRAYWHERTTQL